MTEPARSVIAIGDAPISSPAARRIADVATDLFYHRGFHATTMREIASGVGVKAGSLYNHYSSKHELLFRIAEECSAALYTGAVETLKGPKRPPDEELRALLIWHVTFHARNRYASRVTDTQLHALEPRRRKKVVDIRDAYEHLLRSILARGHEELRWHIANLSIVSIGIETMCTEVDSWYREDGSLTPEEIGEIYADFVLFGLTGK